MPPSLTIVNPPRHRTGDIKLFGHMSLFPPHQQLSHDAAYLPFIQLRKHMPTAFHLLLSVSLPTTATFGPTVSHILRWGSSEQMSRITTNGIITVMKRPFSLQKRLAFSQLQRDTMRPRLLAPESNRSVTLPQEATPPGPTPIVAANIHILPEVFRVRFCLHRITPPMMD